MFIYSVQTLGKKNVKKNCNIQHIYKTIYCHIDVGTSRDYMEFEYTIM